MTTTELLRTAWRFDPVLVAGCIASAAAFASKRKEEGWAARAAYLGAASALLAVALVSPVGTLADGYLFSAHMLQHLLLLLVVPPLALLGLGEPHPENGRNDGTGNRKWRTIGGVLRFLFRRSAVPPVLSGRSPPRVAAAWLAGVGAMWLWHAPRLCDAATRVASVHLAQEVSLLAMGVFFFWPVLAPRPEARLAPLAAVAYLFTACVACTILGIVVTFSPVEVCSIYLHPVDRLGALALLRGEWGLTPARDQELGGLFMWVPACLVYGTAILGILARWYAEPEEA